MNRRASSYVNKRKLDRIWDVGRIGSGLILILMDLGLRFAKRSTEQWLVSKFAGGYLFFIPVWIFGIAVIALNLVNAFLVKK